MANEMVEPGTELDLKREEVATPDYLQNLQAYAKQVVQNQEMAAQDFAPKEEEPYPFQKYGNISSFLRSQAREFKSAFTGGIEPLITDRFLNEEQKKQKAEEQKYWEGYTWLGQGLGYLSPFAKALKPLGVVGEAISAAAVVPKAGMAVAGKLAPNAGMAAQLAAMGATDAAVQSLADKIQTESLDDFANTTLTSIVATPFLAAPQGALFNLGLGAMFGQLSPKTDAARSVLSKAKTLGEMPKSSLEDLSRAYENIDSQAAGEAKVAGAAEATPPLFAFGQENVTAQTVQNAYHLETLVRDYDSLLTKFEETPHLVTDKEKHDTKFFRDFMSFLAYNPWAKQQFVEYGAIDLQNFFNQAKLRSDAQFKYRDPKTGEVATNPKIPLLKDIHADTNAIYETMKDYRNVSKDLEKGIPLEPVDAEFNDSQILQLNNDIVEGPLSFLKQHVGFYDVKIDPGVGLKSAVADYRARYPNQKITPEVENFLLSDLKAQRAGFRTEYLEGMKGSYTQAALEKNVIPAESKALYEAELKSVNERLEAQFKKTEFTILGEKIPGENLPADFRRMMEEQFNTDVREPALNALKMKYGGTGNITGKTIKPSDLLSFLMKTRKNIGDLRFSQLGRLTPAEKMDWVQKRTAIQAQIDKFGETAKLFSENTAALADIDKSLRKITHLFRKKGRPLNYDGERVTGLTTAEVKKLGPSSESAGNIDLTEFLPQLEDLYRILQDSTVTLQKNLGLDAAPYLAKVNTAMQKVKLNIDTLYAMNNNNVKNWYNWQKNLSRVAAGAPIDSKESAIAGQDHLVRMALDFMLPGEQRFGYIQLVRFAEANVRKLFQNKAYSAPFAEQLESHIQLIRATNKQADAIKKEIKSTLESFLSKPSGMVTAPTRAILNYSMLQSDDDGRKKIQQDFQKTIMHLRKIQDNPNEIRDFISKSQAMDLVTPEGGRKTSDRISSILQYLHKEVPKGLSIFEGGGLPPIARQAEYNDKFIAATNPIFMLDILRHGTPTVVQKSVSQMFWPEYWAEFRKQADDILIDNQDLTMAQRTKIKSLFNIITLPSVPSLPTQNPAVPSTSMAQPPQQQPKNAGMNKLNGVQQYGTYTQKLKV